MHTQTHYHPTVVLGYIALLALIVWVSLSNRLKRPPLDRHADALIKVRPDFFKPNEELAEAG